MRSITKRNKFEKATSSVVCHCNSACYLRFSFSSFLNKVFPQLSNFAETELKARLQRDDWLSRNQQHNSFILYTTNEPTRIVTAPTIVLRRSERRQRQRTARRQQGGTAARWQRCFSLTNSSLSPPPLLAIHGGGRSFIDGDVAAVTERRSPTASLVATRRDRAGGVLSSNAFPVAAALCLNVCLSPAMAWR